MTWWLNSVEIVFVIASAGACFGGFTALICSNMRMSRCVRIRCCCLECDRENLSEREYEDEIKNQQQIEGQMARASSAREVQAQQVEEGAV